MGLARDHRSYEEVAFARHLLGIAAPLTVLTGNAEKVGELERAGVPIAGTAPLPPASSPFNLHYLNAKTDGGGGEDGLVPATLPEPVTYFDPFVPEGAPHLICTASYLLPIVSRAWRARRQAGVAPAPGEGPHWFRLHAYFDVAANRERVALTYRARDVVPLARIQHERLLERFLLAGGEGEQGRWEGTVRAFVEHGAGCAVVESAERGGGSAPKNGADDATVRWLLARHTSPPQ
jgi:GTP cyclohydrolase II